MEIINRAPVGRPRKYSSNELERLAYKFNDYIKNTDIPIIAEFAGQAGILKDDIYNYDEFYTLRKMAIDKKEANLERKALTGEVNQTMAIFSLKQLGWSDKHELTPMDTQIRVTIVDDVDEVNGVIDDI